MDDQHKTKEQLLAELAALRQRVAALQESEERFRKVFEEGPIGLLLVGTDGHIQHANRRFCEMLGYAESEIIAVGLAGISHPDDWERDHPFVSRLWRGEISCYHVEKRYLRKDGQVVWGQLTVSLLHDEAGRPINTIGMIEDITERKRAEERLQESKRLLRTLIDASPESLLLLDTDETILLANETSAHRLGIPMDKIVGNKPRDLLPPKAASERIRHFDEVVRTGKAVRFEDKRSGRYYQNAMHPILDEQGTVVAVAVLAIDRTEQKRAEEALQKAHDELEQRVQKRTAELAKANEDLAIFRKFVEAAAEGFGMSDFDGRIAYVNPTLCRLFGEEKPEDVIGKNVSAYYPEQYVQKRKDEIIPASLREGYWHAEQTVLPRHGKPISTLQSTFLIRDEDGNPFRIAVVISDITARKKAEEALRESEEKYRTLVDTCPDAVIMSDLNGRVLVASRQTWGLLGLADSDELVGRSVFDFVIENDRKPLAGNISNLTEVGVRRSTQYTGLRQDGSSVPVEVSSAVIQDTAGRPKAVMATIRDITERKQAQEALERERRTLQHMLRASDHERQLIAYDIHDGLAQQIAGALMQLDVFDHQKANNPKQAADAFQAGMTMLRQSHFEARRLINGVRPPILDESGVVAAIAHLVHEPRGRKTPEIAFHSKVHFDRLEAVEENAIYRIVQEGITNACKHSKSKKGRVSLLQRGNRVRIEIRDWGIGFNPRALPEQRFGLTGIRERARLLGGKCMIRSKPGDGTAIIVELPVVEREPQE
jgi:PAS domain S-box-containing protein